MRERLLSLMGGLMALYLVVALLTPPRPPEQTASSPTSLDRRGEGLAGLYRWLSEEGVPVLSLRQRYGALVTEPGLPARGNLILVSLPPKVRPRRLELETLEGWIAQGNTALLLTALSDNPQWRTQSMEGTELLERLGFTFEADEPVDGSLGTGQVQGSSAPAGGRLAPLLRHPVTAGVQRVETRLRSDERRSWQLVGNGPNRLVLPLLGEAGNGAPALWEARHGEGRLLVTRYGDLFGNITLGQGDNALLMANILQHHLGEAGHVVFDDYHWGVSALYDPQAFYNDPRLHKTLAFIFVLWLLYLVGHSNRLRPPEDRPRPARSVDLSLAVGALFARRLDPRAAGRALFSHFFNELRARRGMPRNGEPVWELLDGDPRLEREQVERLRRLHAASVADGKPSLVMLLRAMVDIRSRLV